MNHAMRRHLGRLLCLAALLGVLGACAPAVHLPRYENAEANLAVFRTRFLATRPAAPGFAMRATLLYVTPHRSNRSDVQLYGKYARPLRLDVRAGLGPMLALMREDDQGLLAFYPENSRAYADADPVVGAQLLGMPFPFSLRDLALVISGDLASLVPPEPDSLTPGPKGGFTLRYGSGPVRRLVLDAHGRPASMEGNLSPYFRTQSERLPGATVSGPRIWSIVFSGYPEDEGEAEGPAKTLTLTLPKGESAVLRVRALTPHPAPWPARSLELTLPDETTYISLERPATERGAPAAIITGGGANEPGNVDSGERSESNETRRP